MIRSYSRCFVIVLLVAQFISLQAMKVVPVQLEPKRIVKFLNIVIEHSPFDKAIPHIKQLAERKPVWQDILSDQKATGDLITLAYDNYEKNRSYTTKVEMAYLLGTSGARAWCKNYLLTNDWEVKCLTKQLLRAGERDDIQRISAILDVGIDVNATDPGSIDDGSACCIGGFDPLLISAVKGKNYDLVKFLLVDKEANPNIKGKKDESTPLITSIQLLHQAENNKQYESFYKTFSIVCLLMKHNFLDLKAMDSNKKTALDYAAEYRMDWLQALIAMGNFRTF